MPIIISHRGNIRGRDLNRENNPKYIVELFTHNIPCEVDLRMENDKFYLGHDKPQYKIDQDFIVKHRTDLFLHCKDRESLEYLNSTLSIINLNYFWNLDDDYSLTSRKHIWTNIGRKICKNSIVVDLRRNPEYNLKCYGVCVDWITNTSSK